MEALKFTLKGKDAFFKMPEVNSYYYFTYGTIPKTALLGIFGAIMGYGGYGQYSRKEEKGSYPEYYERLQNLMVAIVPRKGSRGYFPKKVQAFNNSTGYASYEQGGNLIVKQQWLEEPEWEIYVLLTEKEAEKLADFMLGGRAVFLPYLGSNDHPAVIEGVSLIKLSEVEDLEQIHSLFLEKKVLFDEPEDVIPYKYTEYLPVGLEKSSQMYICEKITFTNLPVLSYEGTVYRDGKRNIVFF